MIEDADDMTDLLGELNGAPVAEAATPKEGEELAAAAKAAVDNPLVVKPAAKPTAAQKLAAKSTEKNPIKGYEITVEGLYSAPAADAPGKKVKKNYSIVVNLPNLDAPLSTIKNKLLDKVLRMKYPGYVTYLTHEIVNVKSLSANDEPSSNIMFMDKETLLAHIKLNRVPVDVKHYGEDLKGLRNAVVDFTLNPKDFAAREAARVKEREEDAELERLNKLS